MVKYHKCHSILKLCNPGIPKPTGMAVPEEMRSLFEGKSPRQGSVSKKKKTKKKLSNRFHLESLLGKHFFLLRRRFLFTGFNN